MKTPGLAQEAAEFGSVKGVTSESGEFVVAKAADSYCVNIGICMVLPNSKNSQHPSANVLLISM